MDYFQKRYYSVIARMYFSISPFTDSSILFTYILCCLYALLGCHQIVQGSQKQRLYIAKESDYETI